MPGLLSLSKALLSKVSARKASAYLQALNDVGEPDPDFEALRFQYFPETITDTKAVNWNPREIPGASLPIYQWVSSGERIISFTTWFTSDMDLFSGEDPADKIATLASAGEISRNIDIRSAAAWLRFFTLPEYGAPTEVGVPLAKAPRRLLLSIPGSGIRASGGTLEASAGHGDDLPCIMTQCDLTYEAFFPSGFPRAMSASLAFAQIAQTGSGVVNFPEAKGLYDYVKGGPGTPQYLGYPLTVTRSR